MNKTIIDEFEKAKRMPTFIKPLRDAIRRGDKTETRRISKVQPKRNNPEPELALGADSKPWPPERDGRHARCGKVGALHYIGEPLSRVATTRIDGKNRKRKTYWATYQDSGEQVFIKGKPLRWKWKVRVLSVRYMPKLAARIFVRVVEKRGEWLHEITEESAKAEGAIQAGLDDDFQSYRDGFSDLWNSINEPRGHGWDKNEFVNVIRFTIGLTL